MNTKRQPEKTIARARELRRDQTHAEKLMWERLRNSHLGVRFRRQAPLGPYFADFLCLELRLIVEVDGDGHAGSKSDPVRTKYLEKLGFSVMRFWNNEIEDSLEGVVQRVEQAVAERRRRKCG